MADFYFICNTIGWLNDLMVWIEAETPDAKHRGFFVNIENGNESTLGSGHERNPLRIGNSYYLYRDPDTNSN